MATLTELTQIYEKGTPGASPLFDKIISGVLLIAEAIRDENPATANHVNRIIWAKQAFQFPKVKAQEMFGAMLAANASATVSQIQGASDAAIQTAITNAVNIFADGGL